MKTSLDNLLNFLCSPECLSLPVEIARQDLRGDDWQEMANKTAYFGGRATIWQHCQLVAVLFDSYPIDSVDIGFVYEPSTSPESSRMYLLSKTNINRYLCASGMPKDENDTMKICFNTDEGVILRRVLETIENHDIQPLMTQIDELNTHMGRFTSEEQARRAAAEAFPEMESLAKAWMLSQIAEQAGVDLREKPRKPGM